MISWLIFGVAWFVPENLSIGWMAVSLIIIAFARVLDGLTGGNTSVTHAYVADISSHKEKGSIFGYLGGIIGVGMIIGPGIGVLESVTSFPQKTLI